MILDICINSLHLLVAYKCSLDEEKLKSFFGYDNFEYFDMACNNNGDWLATFIYHMIINLNKKV